MTSATTPVPAPREPELAGQTVVLIGGSAGIGLETARRARAEGADVILTGRNPDRLKQAALEVGAQRTAAFDATDAAALARFFQDLPEHDRPRDGHGRRPDYAPLLEMDREVRNAISRDHVVLALLVAARTPPAEVTARWHAAVHGRHRRPPSGSSASAITSAATAALPPLIANLALELAPVRVNLIAAGFVDTPLSRIAARRSTSTRAATSCAPRCPSGASSGRPTSPRSPSTS